jgi:uncharacterized membrane protein YccF (DUF307 family)
MSCLGNVIWFIFGGFIAAIMWLIAGLLCCLTIVGIPLGLQCFKFAGLSCFPFGKEIVYGGGGVSLIANILWILFCGWGLALVHGIFGLIYCVTIIGIPFGLQYFKLAKLALMPFGATIQVVG